MSVSVDGIEIQHMAGSYVKAWAVDTGVGLIRFVVGISLPSVVDVSVATGNVSPVAFCNPDRICWLLDFRLGNRIAIPVSVWVVAVRVARLPIRIE